MSTSVPAVDLRPDHWAIVRRALRSHVPDREVLAFGSRATWTAKDYSDLDLAVMGEEPLSLRTVSALDEALGDSDLPFKVDVVDWARIDDAFRRIIRRHGVPVQELPKVSDLTRLTPSKDWDTISFGDAFLMNPPVPIERGRPTPFVEMAAVDPTRRAVRSTRVREFRGSGSRFQNGDTLFARITPCLENGKIARYYANSSMGDVAHGSTEFIVVRGRPGVTDSKYAFYAARSDLVREYAIGQMIGTSGRQRVPTEALAHLNVPLPPLSEQRAIAHVLGTLDDKIELNRRMNETLEAMARALFKSWFVDFDPVRAKMDGRDTGLPQDIADLFPDRLVDSEMGEIPEGWEAKSLRDCMKLTMGQSPPGSTYNHHGDGLPFFQGRSEFGFRYPEKRRFCSAPTRVAKPEDTLVSVRAPVGDINLAWERCCIGRGVAALRHKSGSSSFTYHSAWALQRELREYEHTGTVFGAINKRQFQALKVTEPDPVVVKAFDAMSVSLDARIRSSVAESRTLAALLDTLLPKLISGEIRVPDAEGLVESVP
ncbi:MAG: restriction endonuclease subunit S [Gemmatimonadetes bacterium]|nr:restriction endonuclease subunit S [Gemmatimonadota bacterium]